MNERPGRDGSGGSRKSRTAFASPAAAAAAAAVEFNDGANVPPHLQNVARIGISASSDAEGFFQFRPASGMAAAGGGGGIVLGSDDNDDGGEEAAAAATAQECVWCLCKRTSMPGL